MPTATRPHRNRHLKNRPPWERHSPEWRKRNLARACRTVAAAGLVAAGLLTTPAQAQLPQPFELSNLDGRNGVRIHGMAHDIAGIGDVNGDGFDDIAIGNKSAFPQTGFEKDHEIGGIGFPAPTVPQFRGAVYVLFGTPNPMEPNFYLNNLSYEHQSSEGFAIRGVDSDEQIGSFCSGIGDVNGDGISDFVLGGYHGLATYVIFGKEGGYPHGVDLSKLDGEYGFKVGESRTTALKGLGDVNGDGFDDFAVRQLNHNGFHVIFGKVNWDENFPLSAVNGNNGFRILDTNDNNPIPLVDSYRIAAGGDIDGNGANEIMISNIRFVHDGKRVAGETNILYGHSTNWPSQISLISNKCSDGFKIHGHREYDASGYGIAGIGDISGDGLSDYAVGAPGADIYGKYSSGEVYILFGQTDCESEIDLPNDSFVRKVYYGTETLDILGGVVNGIGDINSDSVIDYVISAAGAKRDNSAYIGRCYFVSAKLEQNSHPQNIEIVATTIQGENAEDRFGYDTSAIGDFNGDGFEDALIGTTFLAEKSYILFGSGTSQQATYASFARAGDAPPSGIGYLGNGTQSSPSSRLWVDFTDGSGFGKDDASLQVATITRRGSDLSNINHAANVYWFLETDRENYIRESQKGIVVGYVEIMVKYLDGEVWHLDENSLALYSAPSPDGPWTLMDNQVLNKAQNRIKARTTSLLPLYFAIAGTPVEQAAIPTPSLLTLTPYTDAWLAPLGPAERFFPPAKIGFTGFRHQFTGWQTMSGDFNGDGVADLATITPWGQWWTALGGTHLGFNPPEKQGVSWHSDPQSGFLVLTGDFDGDGADTLLQLSSTGVLSSVQPPQLGQNPDGPQFLAVTSLRHNPVGGLHVFVADVNGDGADDLVQIDNIAGDISWARSIGTTFAPLSLWGSPGFAHDPANGKGVHFGDFNGDGDLDVCEIAFPQARVALGDGATLAAPTVWNPDLYFQDNSNQGDGWWVFVADVDRDGADDLIQLTDTGEVWTARSNGVDGFFAPTRNTQLGFHHKPDGPWQVFVVE